MRLFAFRPDLGALASGPRPGGGRRAAPAESARRRKALLAETDRTHGDETASGTRVVAHVG